MTGRLPFGLLSALAEMLWRPQVSRHHLCCITQQRPPRVLMDVMLTNKSSPCANEPSHPGVNMPSFLIASCFIVLTALFSNPAFATAKEQNMRGRIAQTHDGMQCGTRLVELGETKASVLVKCGEPAIKDSRIEERRARGGAGFVSIDEWTYNLGSGTFLRILTFENGRLTKVIAGPKVP